MPEDDAPTNATRQNSGISILNLSIFRKHSHLRRRTVLLVVIAYAAYSTVVSEPFTDTFGPFFEFKTLTMFPYDKRLLDLSILTQEEIDWIDDYHKEVYASLSPLLSDEEKTWLADKTSPITK